MAPYVQPCYMSHVMKLSRKLQSQILAGYLSVVTQAVQAALMIKHMVQNQSSVDWRLTGARACPLDLRPRYGIYTFLCANCWNVIGQAPSVGNMHAAEPAALHLALGGCGQYREHL